MNGVTYRYELDKMNYKVVIVPFSQTDDQEFEILTALDLKDVILTRGNKFSDGVSGKDTYNLTELLENSPVEILDERVDTTSSVFDLEYSYGDSEYLTISDKVVSFNSTSIQQNIYVTNFASINYYINQVWH